HAIVAAEYLQPSEIERQGAERELRHPGAGSTQDGTDASDKFVEIKRLGHVVVGAVVEAGEDVGFGVARGDPNHRGLSPPANQAAQLETILSSKHDVQEYEVGTKSIQALEDQVAVADAINLEPGVSEVVRQHVRQRAVVFNEKNAIRSHGFGSPSRASLLQ